MSEIIFLTVDLQDSIFLEFFDASLQIEIIIINNKTIRSRNLAEIDKISTELLYNKSGLCSIGASLKCHSYPVVIPVDFKRYAKC